VRRLPALVDVFWALRHLREVRQVDWSDASLDYRLIEILNRAFDGLYRRYFRMEVRGFENIPGSAAVLVGNHSGFGVAELLMLLVAWYRRFGTTRRPCCLAHQWLYTTPFLRVVVPKIGGVRASWRNARQMLAAGHALTLFPAASTSRRGRSPTATASSCTGGGGSCAWRLPTTRRSCRSSPSAAMPP